MSDTLTTVEPAAPDAPPYAAPPEPVTWTLRTPIVFGSATYETVTLRAPTAAEVLKASALPGQSALDITIRLIAAVSEMVPYEALVHVPAWQISQMADYLDSFAGAPLPDPLEAWRRARIAR